MLYVCSTACLIKLKRFLIILYVFGSDFYHSLCSCLVLTLFFIVLNKFCVEKQVLEFFATHSRIVKLEKCIFFAFFGSLAKRFATHSQHTCECAPKSQKRLRKFHENFFATHLATRPVAKHPEIIF